MKVKMSIAQHCDKMVQEIAQRSQTICKYVCVSVCVFPIKKLFFYRKYSIVIFYIILVLLKFFILKFSFGFLTCLKSIV